jgi:hypothetical protein
MSTKQVLILTFMIFFLCVMLFAMGTWFYWGTEKESKARALESLKLKYVEQESVIRPAGGSNIRQAIDNVENGLKKQLTDATELASRIEKENKTFLVDEYANLKPTLDSNWGAGGKCATNWKAVYVAWNKQLKDIEEALSTSRGDKIKREERVDLAASERDREDENASVETKKVVAELKKKSDEIAAIRVEGESVTDKITDVIRKDRRSSDVKPQGRVIFSAPDLLTARIDIGRIKGVRRGMVFDVYSGAHQALALKARLEITAVNDSSADARILGFKQKTLQDPVTGWEATEPGMKFSPYAASGADEAQSQTLEEPRDKAARVEAYRQAVLQKSQDLTDAERVGREQAGVSAPPQMLSGGSLFVREGDWVFNSEFVPLVSAEAYARATNAEVVAMRDVNISPVTFYFADDIKTFRKEFLKRLCERNRCAVADVMTADVNYVVTQAGNTRADLLRSRVTPKEKGVNAKDKDGAEVKENEADPAQIKMLKKTLQALEDGKKVGADVLAEDELEAFFTRRQRKQELLRGKTVQPGQFTFFIAGETKDRSVDQLRRFIGEHGGMAARVMDSSVDYVVAGQGLNKEFYDKVKKLGLRIIRENELPKFFGLE